MKIQLKILEDPEVLETGDYWNRQLPVHFRPLLVKILYPSPFAKAAAVAESLIINHPFIDGNKRTGIVVMIALLREYNLQVNANNNSLYEFTISISTGEIKFDQIIEWLKMNTEAL